MQDTRITLTTTDGRIWKQVPSLPTPGIPGVLRLDFRCGARRATLFKGRPSRDARFTTPSGKRLEVASISLEGASVTASGNVAVRA